jgi:flagellar motility protein MotE (MotC chaperone)
MRQYKKVMVFLLIGWGVSLVSVGPFSAQFHQFIPVHQAFAEDEAAQENAPSEEKGDSEQTKEDQTADGTDENPCPECPECPDPAKVVLRGLEEKKTQVEREHKAMLEERKQLALFEEQIDEKLEKLNALKKQIKEDMALLEQKKTQKELEKETAYENQMRRLVKTYETMKPKAAAPIVDKMNLEVAQEIFLRMKEAAASQILSFVDSEKAAKISERLAFKQE